MIPISALLQPISATQARATFVLALKNLGIPADTWNKGGVASTILTVVATSYSNFSATMTAALQAGFLPTASGAWLVLLAFYVYGVSAIASTFATGALTLTNTQGGVFTYAAGQAIFGNAATGAQYTNQDAFTLNAATLSGPTTLAINVQSVKPGTASNANPGDVSVLVSSMLGVTVNNPLAIVGQDAEPDAALRVRCMNKLASLSVRGPRNAYVWAATSALNSTGQPVNINRVSVLAPLGTGTITLYVASPSGVPTADDLAAVVANVEAQVRPEGIVVTTLSVAEVNYAPSLTVWVQNVAGLNVAALTAAIQTALAAYIAAYPIGGLTTDFGTGLFGGGIQGVIASTVAANGTVAFAVELSGGSGKPAPDLPLVAGQVATDEITIQVRTVTS